MRIFIIAFFVVLPFAAHAADSYFLEDLTWPEVKARMEKGTDSIIIPTGGTEQNGPAITIGKHNWIVKFTSGEIARTLGNALAAPVIAYVPEEGHMKFPGTISVSDEHFAGILEDAARSFKQHGFKHIYFLGDSGGNQASQEKVAKKLSEEWKKDGVLVLSVSDYYEDKKALAWTKKEKLGGADASAHAGFMDASEVSAVSDKAVRKALVKPYDKKDFATTGAMGDATGASAEYGKKLLAFKIKAAVEQIRAAKP